MWTVETEDTSFESYLGNFHSSAGCFSVKELLKIHLEQVMSVTDVHEGSC